METGILDLLINGSPMAAFAGFLIYLYRTQQSRMDSLVDKFQERLESIRKEYKEDVSVLRNRYDAVISGQNDDRSKIKSQIAEKVNAVILVVDKIKSDNSQVILSQEIIKDELLSLEKDVTQGLEIIKSMQEQVKLKEIAKQAMNQNPLS